MSCRGCGHVDGSSSSCTWPWGIDNGSGTHSLALLRLEGRCHISARLTGRWVRLQSRSPSRIWGGVENRWPSSRSDERVEDCFALARSEDALVLVRLVDGSLLFQPLRLCCSSSSFFCRPQHAHDLSTFRGRDRHAKGLLMRDARVTAAWNDGCCAVRQTCLDQELGAWRPWKRGGSCDLFRGRAKGLWKGAFAKLDSGPVLRFWMERQDRGPWVPKHIVGLATRAFGTFQVKIVSRDKRDRSRKRARSFHHCVSIPTLPCIPSTPAPGDWDVFPGCCRQVARRDLAAPWQRWQAVPMTWESGCRARQLGVRNRRPGEARHQFSLSTLPIIRALPREHRLVFLSSIRAEF